MLKVTKKFEYGLIAVRYIAMTSNGEVATAKEISERMGIPYELLAKTLQRLTKAGVITSVQGVKGGYKLSRPPKQITLGEIAEAIEGPLNLTECQATQDTCHLYSTCAIKKSLVHIQQRFQHIFDQATVDEIL
ncbi:transcriptional regulator, BadM/Rrf2 family [Chloroherpeton thalassium ATCC 35110]|uniref:Transcriptional regulator, BadM/Rrf2 family n=1 Tax=Chloroherpeton thalassium (strain ATCC 35110 / GB-78) TaxID=517418 RepID=B3QYR6_CHLT3|nr:Rrf2 family transcriptional regulator [Chloroherpeton thalassium]ACF15139.1 transcriptional regulator, BadM/Rrf2 family [Chloroherpeton thalassium ATCC 35110]